MPPLFALCLVGFHNQQPATFAAFGTFAMLAFADFIGRWEPASAPTRSSPPVRRTTWSAVVGMAARRIRPY